LILLADANVLIDLYLIEGLTLPSKLAPTEVLDYVLSECDTWHQPGMGSKVQAAGISIIQTEDNIQHSAATIKIRGLSFQDRLNIAYARTYKRILLSGEKRLRDVCGQEGIEIHGSLWLIQQAHANSLFTKEQLCKWLERLSQSDRYLPEAELVMLKKHLGCS